MNLRTYIGAVIVSALICAVATGLTKNTRGKDLIRMLCGLLLTISLLRPVTGMDLGKLDLDQILNNEEGSLLAEQGEDMACDAMRDIIKQKTEAYILDKALSLSADVQVEVVLKKKPAVSPEAVTIKGEVSAYTKSCLSEIIQTDLGIALEEQKWMGLE